MTAVITNPDDLVLERKDEDETTGDIAPGIMMTPAIDEDFWSYRVLLSETQAIVGFPKYTTIGIGFAVEEDWNTNLPYRCSAEKIFDHVRHNKGDEAIPDEVVMRAIEMVRQGAADDRDDGVIEELR